MGTSQEVALRYTADLIAFKAQLATMPGITQDVTKRSMNRFAAEMSAGTKTGVTSIAKELKTAAPMLAAATGRVGSLAGAALSLGPAGAAAALAIGAVTLAVRVFSEDGERAARVTKEIADAHAALKPMLEKTRLAIVDLDEATGKLTDAEAEHARIGISSLAEWSKAMGAVTKRQAEITRANEGWSATIGDLGEKLGGFVGRLNPTVLVIDGLTTSTSENREEQEELDRVLADSIATLRTLRETTEDASRAKDANTAATKAQAKAEKEAADFITSLHAELDRTDRELTAAAMARGEEDGDRDRAEWEAQEEAAKHLAEVRIEAAKDAAEAEIRQRERVRESVISSTEDILSTTSDAFAQAAEDMPKRAKAEALRLWRVSQAAAAAQLVLSELVSVAKAFELGPVAGGVAAVATAATFAALLAQLKSAEPPSFPLGGIVSGRQADHVTISAAAGEGVVNRRGMSRLGEDGLDALNRGENATQSVVVEMRYKHRVFDRFVADNLKRNGPLRRALRDASRT